MQDLEVVMYIQHNSVLFSIHVLCKPAKLAMQMTFKCKHRCLPFVYGKLQTHHLHVCILSNVNSLFTTSNQKHGSKYHHILTVLNRHSGFKS